MDGRLGFGRNKMGCDAMRSVQIQRCINAEKPVNTTRVSAYECNFLLNLAFLYRGRETDENWNTSLE
jgi:hypothetical protein